MQSLVNDCEVLTEENKTLQARSSGQSPFLRTF